MVTGILIFILFYLTGARWLMDAGIVTLYAGTLAVIVGFCMLTIHAVRLFRNGIFSQNSRKIFLGYVLLLSNFPIAAILCVASVNVTATSTVLVSNMSPFLIQEVVLIGPSGREQYHILKIPAGKSKKDRFHIEGEGGVKFEVVIGTKTESGTLFGYITSGMSQSATIFIDEKSRVTVKEVVAD